MPMPTGFRWSPQRGHLLLSVPAFQDTYGPFDTFVGHFRHFRRYEPDHLVQLLRSIGRLVRISLRLYQWPLGYALEAIRIHTRKLARAQHSSPAQFNAACGPTFQPRSSVVGAGIAL